MGTEIVPVKRTGFSIKKDIQRQQDWQASQSLASFIESRLEAYLRQRPETSETIPNHTRPTQQDLDSTTYKKPPNESKIAPQRGKEKAKSHELARLKPLEIRKSEMVQKNELERLRFGQTQRRNESGLRRHSLFESQQGTLTRDTFDRNSPEDPIDPLFQTSTDALIDEFTEDDRDRLQIIFQNEPPDFQAISERGSLFGSQQETNWFANGPIRSKQEKKSSNSGLIFQSTPSQDESLVFKEKSPRWDDHIVRSDNPEFLADTLADIFTQEVENPLGNGSFKAELISKGESFTITPLKLEPLSFEEAIEAPLDVKVNLLVKGAALLEKRKHEPPPLTRRETREIEKRKGLILRAIDDIVERGAGRAGKLVADKWGRRGLSFVGAAGLAISASACANDSQEIIPSPLPVEPIPTETFELPTLAPEPSATPFTAISGRPYPENDNGFILGAGGQDVAEERIRDLGAGPDIEQMKGMLIAEMNRTGINSETIEWEFAINEQAENPSWTMWPKDRISGHFLLPRLTTGPEAGQLIRSGNLFAYLDREIGDDFFDLVELQNPQGLASAEQRIIPDSTGWFVPGGFTAEGEILEWFSVDRDEWITNSDLVVEVEPLVELEDLPTTCLDPELQTEVEADFLDEQGYASRQEALDELENDPAYDKNISWGGFENGANWYNTLQLAVMGSSRITLAEQSENQADEFALCLLAITPNYPDKIIPLIVGVERDGEWSQTTALAHINFDGWIEHNTPEDAEEWIRETRGRLINPFILLRFDKPDWERDPFWHFGYDHVLPELRRDGRYVLRYTTDPSVLEALERPGIRQPTILKGEFAQVDAVIDDMDPEHDIGLFTFQLYVVD